MAFSRSNSVNLYPIKTGGDLTGAINPTNSTNLTNPITPMSIKRTIIASALMILTMVCLRYMTHGENIQPNKPLSTFPKQIGEWTGKEERFDKRIYDILGVDDSFLCHYRTSDGRQVNLYVGFYESQREGDLIHSPKHCMPGPGGTLSEH